MNGECYLAARNRVTSPSTAARTMNRPAESACPVNGAQLSRLSVTFRSARFSGRPISARAFMLGEVEVMPLYCEDLSKYDRRNDVEFV